MSGTFNDWLVELGIIAPTKTATPRTPVKAGQPGVCDCPGYPVPHLEQLHADSQPRRLPGYDASRATEQPSTASCACWRFALAHHPSWHQGAPENNWDGTALTWAGRTDAPFGPETLAQLRDRKPNLIPNTHYAVRKPTMTTIPASYSAEVSNPTYELRQRLEAAVRAVDTARNGEQRRIRDSNQAATHLRDARHNLKAAQNQLELIEVEARNPEPEVGSVVAFTLTHEEGGNAYSYAAIRVGHRWFTTGATCPSGGYSWGALLEFIGSAHHSTILENLGRPRR